MYGKMDYFSPWDPPPRQKIFTFAKMTNIRFNIKIRGISLFYKKGVLFPKKFSDKMKQFSPLEVRIYIPHRFCSLARLVGDKQLKNRSKMDEKCGLFPRDPPGENGTFLQNYPKLCITSPYAWFHYFAKMVQNSRKTF